MSVSVDPWLSPPQAGQMIAASYVVCLAQDPPAHVQRQPVFVPLYHPCTVNLWLGNLKLADSLEKRGLSGEMSSWCEIGLLRLRGVCHELTRRSRRPEYLAARMECLEEVSK